MNRKLLYGFLYLVIILLLAGVVQYLWNAILPQILHAPVVNYWHALVLLLLCRLLFGGFHFGNIIRKIQGDDPSHITKEKLLGDDEDTRASFKEEWRKRCERRGQS